MKYFVCSPHPVDLANGQHVSIGDQVEIGKLSLLEQEMVDQGWLCPVATETSEKTPTAKVGSPTKPDKEA